MARTTLFLNTCLQSNISNTVHDIFQSSVDSELMPKIWKKAYIIAVLKKGNGRSTPTASVLDTCDF